MVYAPHSSSSMAGLTILPLQCFSIIRRILFTPSLMTELRKSRTFNDAIAVTIVSRQLLHIFLIFAFLSKIIVLVGVMILSGCRRCPQKPLHHSVSQALWHCSLSEQSEQWTISGVVYATHKHINFFRKMVRIRMR